MTTTTVTKGMSSNWLVYAFLIAILVIPSTFFIFQSYQQMEQLLQDVNEPVELSSSALLNAGNLSASEQIKLSLERDVMSLRHKRASTLLNTRTWMRFMSLIFGSILVVVGGAFILGQVASPPIEGKVGLERLGITLATSSPGIWLAAFGVVLIAIPNLSTQQIIINDTATYVKSSMATSPVSGPSAMAQAFEESKKNSQLKPKTETQK